MAGLALAAVAAVSLLSETIVDLAQNVGTSSAASSPTDTSDPSASSPSGSTDPEGTFDPSVDLPDDDDGGPGGPQSDLDTILGDYQIAEDELVDWKPQLGALPFDVPLVDSRLLTKKEADLLDRLASQQGLLGLKKFDDIANDAFATSEQYYPVDPNGGNLRANDNHTDAFRHAYWSARLAQEFGPEFATAFTEAHEGTPENVLPAREAMDLYNNSIGIEIAVANPDASPDELADLIDDAITGGELVVIDAGGDLAFSDDVAVGNTGHPVDMQPRPGRDPEEWDAS